MFEDTFSRDATHVVMYIQTIMYIQAIKLATSWKNLLFAIAQSAQSDRRLNFKIKILILT